MKFLSSEQRNEIGFQFILDELNVLTPFGNDEKINLKPFERKEKKHLSRELDLIEIVLDKKRENKKSFGEISRQFMKIKDIRNTLKKCSAGECLDEVELFELKVFSMISEELRKCVDEIDFQEEEFRLNDLTEVIDILDPCKKRMQTFHIYEEYSDRLKEIRFHKKSVEEKMYKEKDRDSLEILKEERLSFVVKEGEECFRIRETLTKELKSFSQKVQANIVKIGRMDFIFSKADMAQKYDGIKPKISEKMIYTIKEGINPFMVELIKKKNKGSFTGINIDISRGSTIITGANMGGKSITLKTIALNMLLMQCGFYVFAQDAELPLVDFIYLISDDMQSISKGLSTFGAEIIALKRITEHAKVGKGLIAFDEFARGTNPFEGKKLVQAVAEHFHSSESISIFATHYDGVVKNDMEHYQVKGLKNVDFEALKRKIELQKKNSVEIIQEHMDYGLEKVRGNGEVPKDALNIATLLGMDKNIILKIQDLYEEEN